MNSIKRDKKKRKLLSLIRNNNGGNTLVLVVVVMFVVMLLGIAIMYASYTSLMLRTSQRKSQKTFSSAETGMNLVREGILEAESDALAAGYQAVIENLSGSTEENQKRFNEEFVEYFKRYQINGKNLFTTKDGILTAYDPDALNVFLDGKIADGDGYELDAVVGKDPQTGAETLYTSPGNRLKGRVDVMPSDGRVILRNVRLTYTKKDGYSEQITTDLVMKAPKIKLSPSQTINDRALEGFCAIADKGIVSYKAHESGSGQVSTPFSGSVYAGRLFLRNNTYTVPDGKRVVVGQTRQVRQSVGADGYTTTYSVVPNSRRTSGEIALTGSVGGGVTVKSGGQLWAYNMELKNNTSLTTERDSHVFIGNDLNFVSGGNFTLGGHYYGFGYGDKAKTSSSIIFDSRNSATTTNKIDISGMQSLILAGRTFVVETEHGDSVGMGSSITARPEQVAYLVPENLFNTVVNASAGSDQTTPANSTSYTNPRVIEKGDAEYDPANDMAIDSVNPNIFNQKMKSLGNHKLSEYGINSTADIKVLTYNVPGADQCVRYYFLNFPTQRNANDYFKEYFKNNAETMQAYLDSYVDLKGFNTNGSRVLSGGTTLRKTSNGVEPYGGDNVNEKDASKYSTKYDNLSATLSEGTSFSEENPTPFYTYIDVTQLHKLCKNQHETNSTDAVTIQPEEGNGTKIKAYWGDFDVHADQSIHAIVVDGDVYVNNHDFSGIIICSGTIYANSGGIGFDSDTGIKNLKKSDIWKAHRPKGNNEKGDSWNIDDLVTYQNWTKD